MKEFKQHNVNPTQVMTDVADLERLLKGCNRLSEKRDLLPFFNNHEQLAGALGFYTTGTSFGDKIALEFDIFGDFKADIVVGNSKNQEFLLIELEDAKPYSIFKKTTRTVPDWAPRFEHGYSQIIDWLWRLEDVRRTSAFTEKFGSNDVVFHGLLVIGRRQRLQQREQNRLRWRQDRTIVNSRKISCVTYDDLVTDLGYWASLWKSD